MKGFCLTVALAALSIAVGVVEADISLLRDPYNQVPARQPDLVFGLPRFNEFAPVSQPLSLYGPPVVQPPPDDPTRLYDPPQKLYDTPRTTTTTTTTTPRTTTTTTTRRTTTTTRPTTTTTRPTTTTTTTTEKAGYNYPPPGQGAPRITYDLPDNYY